MLTLKNSGNASATISQISSAASGFTTSALATPYVLAAGGTVTLQITFSPTSPIAYASSLSITSNAANAPLIVALSGSGTPVP
jgi:hypothetical protein